METTMILYGLQTFPEMVSMILMDKQRSYFSHSVKF